MQAGQTLHLNVAEVTPDQVTLRLDKQAMLAAAAAASASAAADASEEPPRRLRHGDALRRTRERTNRAAQVRVTPRPDPFDAYG